MEDLKLSDFNSRAFQVEESKFVMKASQILGNKNQQTEEFDSGLGVYSEESDLEITGSRFDSLAVSRYGGAIYSSKRASSLDNKALIIVDSVFKNCFSGVLGGAIFT